VHFYSLGHPIVGDPLYGNKALQSSYPRLMLHARRLTLDQPPGKRLTLEAPIPESFSRVLRTVAGE
jgi:23S rRNA-/tRNA-specific pseudouridylate synthase